jgi:hypothetical protein
MEIFVSDIPAGDGGKWLTFLQCSGLDQLKARVQPEISNFIECRGKIYLNSQITKFEMFSVQYPPKQRLEVSI